MFKIKDPNLELSTLNHLFICVFIPLHFSGRFQTAEQNIFEYFFLVSDELMSFNHSQW
jgi:hypothetical protein